MDSNGQIYFDLEKKVPTQDKARLERAMAEARVREAAVEAAQEAIERLRRELPRTDGPGLPD